MLNKFWNRLRFMFEQIFRNSYMKYFFERTISKLTQFTPFASINILSKRELLIISAEFLPLSCASIQYIIIDNTNWGIISFTKWLFVYDYHWFFYQYYDWSGGTLGFQVLMPQAEVSQVTSTNSSWHPLCMKSLWIASSCDTGSWVSYNRIGFTTVAVTEDLF